jgi:hypothetical protein
MNAIAEARTTLAGTTVAPRFIDGSGLYLLQAWIGRIVGLGPQETR